MALASNPFATRFIRPGAIAFLFAGEDSAEALIDRLRKQHWMGQIIGPHGSGKSTLLATLLPLLAAAERKVVELKGKRPAEMRHQAKVVVGKSLDAGTQLVIDGFEQLSWWSQRKIKDACQRQGAGLLVTTHRDMGLPILWQTDSTPELARNIVARLLPVDDRTIEDAEIEKAYSAAGGNLRETLFALYDVYQNKTQSTAKG